MRIVKGGLDLTSSHGIGVAGNSYLVDSRQHTGLSGTAASKHFADMSYTARPKAL